MKSILLTITSVGLVFACGSDDSGDGALDGSVDAALADAAPVPDSMPLPDAFTPPVGAVRWEVGMGGNGHYYLPVNSSESLSWSDAKVAAETLGGYLVSLRSESENTFVFELVQGDDANWAGQPPDSSGYQRGPWIGARQQANSTEPEGGWRWENGERFTFHAWRTKLVPDPQPNDFNGEEEVAHFMAFDERQPLWNDAPDESSFGVFSYVVEFGPPEPDVPPKPGLVRWTQNSGGNGNWYQVVTRASPISWSDARIQARALGGHLATVASEEENQFVFGLIGNNDEAWGGTPGDAIGEHSGPWLGGLQSTVNDEPTGNWSWITGEQWSETAWLAAPLSSVQPDNLGGDEHFLAYMAIDGRQAFWGDASENSGLHYSFIVEYGEFP